VSVPYLPDLAWERAGALIGAGAIGLLPVGATESHGPHLPLWTDVYLSLELSFRIGEALSRAGGQALVLAPVTLAVTRYASAFAGTLSISAATERAVLDEVLAHLARHGMRRVALVNSHLEPEHVAILAATASQDDAIAVFVDHCRKPWALELGSEFRSGDAHAGCYETSLLLASRYADRVDLTAMASLPPCNAGLVKAMRAGVGGFAEMGAARSYFGDPARATRAEGEALWAVLVRMWVERLSERSTGG